jgi:cell division septum initiation protein DivIVA
MDPALLTALVDRGSVVGYNVQDLERFFASATAERTRLQAAIEQARRRLARAVAAHGVTHADQRRIAELQAAREELTARRTAARAEVETILAAATLEADALVADARRAATQPTDIGETPWS